LKYLFLILLFISFKVCVNDTLKILFVYGSKPIAKEELKIFGGINGGHVSLKYKEAFASFVHKGSLHLFPRKKIHADYIVEKDRNFREDTSISRHVIVDIPINDTQAKALDSVISQRLKHPGYDYAFLGFRCASSAYEVLASAGIFKRYSKTKIKLKFFYPKRLRKHVLKQANQHHWHMHWRPGKATRKWEKD
jgi:hypothetical protein